MHNRPPSYPLESLRYEIAQMRPSRPSRQWAYDILAGEQSGVHPKTGLRLTQLQLDLARRAVLAAPEIGRAREPGEDDE